MNYISCTHGGNGTGFGVLGVLGTLGIFWPKIDTGAAYVSKAEIEREAKINAEAAEEHFIMSSDDVLMCAPETLS